MLLGKGVGKIFCAGESGNMRHRPFQRPGCRTKRRYDDETPEHSTARFIRVEIGRPANSISVNVSVARVNSATFGSREAGSIVPGKECSLRIAWCLLADRGALRCANSVAQGGTCRLIKSRSRFKARLGWDIDPDIISHGIEAEGVHVAGRLVVHSDPQHMLSIAGTIERYRLIGTRGDVYAAFVSADIGLHDKSGVNAVIANHRGCETVLDQLRLGGGIAK